MLSMRNSDTIRNLAISLIPVILIGSLSGCAKTREVLYDKTVRSAKPDTYHVSIYYTDEVHRPYKVIGIVITSTGPFHHVLAATEELQHAAREMGGDALIAIQRKTPKGLEMPPGELFSFGAPEYILSAKVIVWEK